MRHVREKNVSDTSSRLFFAGSSSLEQSWTGVTGSTAAAAAILQNLYVSTVAEASAFILSCSAVLLITVLPFCCATK
jgi:hypothetical protein